MLFSQVIGDKKAALASIILLQSEGREHLQDLERKLGTKPKFIHVVRNPFDHIARQKSRRTTRTTRTRVVRLGAQCTDHWTTEQSRGVGVPAVQLTTHVKSSTLYGRTSKFFRLDGLLLFCIIMGKHPASSAMNYGALKCVSLSDCEVFELIIAVIIH